MRVDESRRPSNDGPSARGPRWSELGYPSAELCHECSLPEPALMPGPRHVTVLLTWKCNLRCVMCPVPGCSGPQEMDTTLVLDVLGQLDALGTSHITLSGGEPLMRQDLFEILEAIAERKHEASYSLCTNATLIDRRAAERIAGPCQDWRFLVSLDGHDAATHDLIRGVPRSFDRAIEGIGELIDALEGGGNIGVNTVLNRANYRNVPELLEILARLGVGTVRLSPAYPDSTAPEFVLRREEMVDLLRKSPQFVQQGRDLGLRVIDLMPFAAVTMSACFLPWIAMTIDPEGRVAPCNTLLRQETGAGGYEVGNVRDRSLAAIWRSDAYMKFRRGALTHDHAVCGEHHCGAVDLQTMNFNRGPCRSCRSGRELDYPFAMKEIDRAS